MPHTTPKPRKVAGKGTVVPETPATLARSPEDRAMIERQGGKVTTLAQFLDLSEAEMRLIDLKIGLTRAIVRLRKEAKLTQATLAKQAGVSRPRIAEIEACQPKTSFDSILPVYFAVGGTASEFAELVMATERSMEY